MRISPELDPQFWTGLLAFVAIIYIIAFVRHLIRRNSRWRL